MKELLILRHAKSSWDDPSLSDHDRPLNKRGRKASKRMGQLLADEDIVPDLILSSTAERAWKTARRAAKSAGYEGEIEAREALYHASAATILGEVAQVDDAHARVMVVGHNPGMEALTGMLSGVFHRFPTAALLHVGFEDMASWSQVRGRQATLLGFWLPRILME